jgi:hypothetical protein
MKTFIIILSMLAVSGFGTMAEARPYFRYHHHRHFYGPGGFYNGPVFNGPVYRASLSLLQVPPLTCKPGESAAETFFLRVAVASHGVTASTTASANLIASYEPAKSLHGGAASYKLHALNLDLPSQTG